MVQDLAQGHFDITHRLLRRSNLWHLLQNGLSKHWEHAGNPSARLLCLDCQRTCLHELLISQQVGVVRLSLNQRMLSLVSSLPHRDKETLDYFNSQDQRTSDWEWRASAAPHTPPSSCLQSWGRLAPDRRREACTPLQYLKIQVEMAEITLRKQWDQPS